MAIPLIVAGIGAGLAAAGGGTAMATGTGKNDRSAQNFYDPDGTKRTGYNANAANYGGCAGGLQARNDFLASQRERADYKAAEYGTQQAHLYDRGNAGLDQANQARGNQVDAMNLARARATGATPSIAQMQADRQMGQAAAEQASAAASARGPAALALAQQNAAANTASAQSNISGQAQINAANERMQAEQAYASQAAGLRGADVGQANTAYGAGAQSGQLGLGYTNAAQGYERLTSDAMSQAGQMKMQEQQILSGSHNQMDLANVQREQNNANNTKDLLMTMFSQKGGGTSAGSFTSDMNAKNYVPMPGPDSMTLDQAMSAQVSQDREDLANARIDDALSKKEEQRTANNKAIFDSTRAKFAADQKENVPWYMTDISGGGGNWGQLANMFSSSEETKDYKGVYVPVHGTDEADRTRMSDAGRAYIAASEDAAGPSIAGAAPRYSTARPSAEAEKPAPKRASGGGKRERKMSNEELAKWADSELATVRAKTDRLPTEGTAVDAALARSGQDPVAQANRSYEGALYSYKPEYLPAEQAPGEVNFGPTAQNMQQSPIAATAVKQNPATGKLGIDRDKATKLSLGGLASLQRQVDLLRAQQMGAR